MHLKFTSCSSCSMIKQFSLDKQAGGTWVEEELPGPTPARTTAHPHTHTHKHTHTHTHTTTHTSARQCCHTPYPSLNASLCAKISEALELCRECVCVCVCV